MMASRTRAWVISLTLLLCLGLPHMTGAAQDADAHEFGVFWKQFSQAVVEDKRATVADLTKLPFLLDGIEQDRSAFLREYPTLFQEGEARSRSRRVFRRLRRADLCVRAGERELSVH